MTPEATVKKYLTVRREGRREVKCLLDYYNLERIIFVGYEVKIHVATRFRIWAAQRLDSARKAVTVLEICVHFISRKIVARCQIVAFTSPTSGAWVLASGVSSYTRFIKWCQASRCSILMGLTSDVPNRNG